MSDVCIDFTAADRKRHCRRPAATAVILAGVTVAAALSTAAPGRWSLLAGPGVMSVASVADRLDRIHGRTLVTTTGLRSRTFVSRR
ncbi:hypothetical protein [Streptomyces werraensis]|uniref:hypothetical protein n=1 Tax=Streptomyces werraensis TaxID=68284 RepID=UPI00341F279A